MSTRVKLLHLNHLLPGDVKFAAFRNEERLEEDRLVGGALEPTGMEKSTQRFLVLSHPKGSVGSGKKDFHSVSDLNFCMRWMLFLLMEEREVVRWYQWQSANWRTELVVRDRNPALGWALSENWEDEISQRWALVNPGDCPHEKAWNRVEAHHFHC